MRYYHLNQETNLNYVGVELHLQDVKILHNACVDILREHPEMIGYRNVMTKLAMVIEDSESRVYELPF